jgi:hypothetical protein
VLDRALWFPPGTEPLRILITYDPGFVLPDPFFDEAGAIQWAPYDLGFTWTAEVSFLGGGQGAGSGVLHGEWTNNPDEGGAFWTQIYTSTVAPPATAVAEPATALLLLAGLAGIAARLRRRPHEHA